MISHVDADLTASTWIRDEHKLRRVIYAWRYVGPRRSRRRQSMHRIILSRILRRELVRAEKVDHIDGNGLNNTRENLRLASHAQNKMNMPKPSKANATSKYKGVSWSKRERCWCAFITIEGKSTYLGGTRNEEEAARLYDAAAKEHFGEFAYLNFSVSQGVRLVKKVTGQV